LLEPYLQILRLPHARRLVASAFVARVPYGITPLATVLLVRKATGSYTDAGVVAAAQAIGWGAVAPVQGRLVDRFSQRVVLPGATLNALMLVALAAAAGDHASVATLAIVAAIGGAATPPLSASMRAIWVAMIPDEARRNTAFALETVIMEVCFISGPLLTALLVAVNGPSAAMIAAAVMMFVGSLALTTSAPSRAWRSTATSRRLAGPLASVGMRTLLYAILPIGLAFGTLGVVIPAIATRHHQPAAAGLLSAAFAAGSLVGGLWYGSRRWRGSMARRYLVLNLLFAVGMAPLLIVGGIPIMCLLLALAGASLAPVTTCLYALTEDVAPPGTTTEAFTWTFTANSTGAAGGSALAGAVIQSSGIRPALFIAVGGAATGAVITALRRRTLSPANGPVTDLIRADDAEALRAIQPQRR
jgi:MFS family permease